jgi:hypothetical protein
MTTGTDPRYVSLVLEQGRTLKQPWRDRDDTGAVIDYPGAGYTSAVLEVRDKHISEGGEVLLRLTTDDGGVVLGPYDDGTGELWSGYLYATASAMGELLPWGEAHYELVGVHGGGDVDRLRYGVAILLPATTEV